MAAVADWDEESLLIASRRRDFKHRRCSVLDSKTPPTNSSRRVGIGIAKIEGDLRLWMFRYKTGNGKGSLYAEPN
ncbi:hypothetical protein DVH24_006837 [Malus domestica]|uniref:Uncharacterized protein n=1 Tax=Malus domestica TaxID=3750 RepID=A0A498JAR3_MALDO|nr:hypothetical protein DVH24_006837 [Malus domestica]